MGQFELHETPTAGVRLHFDQFLYNSPSFLRSNNSLLQKHFYLYDSKRLIYRAHLAFSCEAKLVMSPVKAPFGGIEADEQLTVSELKDFISMVESSLTQSGFSELRLHQAPENYMENGRLNQAFEQLGYEIIQERFYHGIDIDELPLSEKIEGMQKRRLKKCKEAGFPFKKYAKKELAAAFEQIDRWRNAAEKSLSMTWADLHDSSKRNPHAYHAFGVENEHGLMIAGAIVVRVNEQVIYNFFPAHYDAYNQFSPMVMLMDGIYEWARENGYKHYDLGTSYVHKKVNSSLKLFKERMGGKTYSAWSWRKSLN